MRILTGIDILKISRFDTHLSDRKFLDRSFTAVEQEYCFSTVNPAEHLAARFAVKEAVIKAVSDIVPDFYDMKQLEVIREKSGRPSLLYRGENPVLKNAKVDISISHDGEYAVASAVVAVIEKE